MHDKLHSAKWCETPIWKEVERGVGGYFRRLFILDLLCQIPDTYVHPHSVRIECCTIMTTPFSRLATPTGLQTPSSYTYGDPTSDTDLITHTAQTNLSPATYQENRIENVSSLKDLLSSLIESQVPGPQLYRLKPEFSILEEGGQSEIFGVGVNTQETLAEAMRCGQLERDARPVEKIVIKRH